MSEIDHQQNLMNMRRGELYYAFTPQLIAVRKRCNHACFQFNMAGEVSRRRLVELWKEDEFMDLFSSALYFRHIMLPPSLVPVDSPDITLTIPSVVNDDRPLPSNNTSEGEDELLFANDPWIDCPIKVDYGINLRIGTGVYINSNCTFIDTCLITIGSRTLIGPNCAFYYGTHPLDPFLRNGINGPELGKPISIGEDCWLGGNVVVLPGITIGRGVTVGAGSIVTKDVPPFHCVVGNPARIIRKIEVNATDPLLALQQHVSEVSKLV